MTPFSLELYFSNTDIVYLLLSHLHINIWNRKAYNQWKLPREILVRLNSSTLTYFFSYEDRQLFTHHTRTRTHHTRTVHIHTSKFDSVSLMSQNESFNNSLQIKF